MMCERDLVRALHDLAHVMIAPPGRRLLPEFGLGPDPANMQNNIRLVVSQADADIEEGQACDLHWCLAAYLEGVDGACEVEDYVNTNTPDATAVEDFGQRFVGVLPSDFTSVVLGVRQERLCA